MKLGNPRLRAGSSAAIAAARQARTRYAKKRTAELLPYIDAARRAGAVTLREIADAMEARGIRTPSGRTNWHPATVLHVLRAIARRLPRAKVEIAITSPRRTTSSPPGSGIDLREATEGEGVG